MKSRSILIASLLLIPLLAIAGCVLTPEQKAQAQVQLDRAQRLRNATTQAAADAHADAGQLRATATTLPANDPVRTATLTSADAIDRVASEYEKRVPAIDSSIAALQAAIDGDPINFGKALEGVPVVGKYAALIMLLGTIGVQGWTNLKKTGVIKEQAVAIDNHEAENAKLNKVATQLVQSVENVLPSKSDDVKLKLAEHQDADTKQFVASTKFAITT